jgi:hypothetical protein
MRLFFISFVVFKLNSSLTSFVASLNLLERETGIVDGAPKEQVKSNNGDTESSNLTLVLANMPILSLGVVKNEFLASSTEYFISSIVLLNFLNQ